MFSTSTPHLSAAVVANAEASSGSAAIQFGILLLIPLAMYFLLIRPQRKRARQQQALQSSISVGDDVVTTSGIFGTITGEDGDTRFWLEIDDDVQIRVARAAIANVVSEDEPAEEAADDTSSSGSSAED